MKIQQAVRDETVRMAEGCAGCCAALLALFWLGHLVLPDYFPFDYTVVLAAVLGTLVAVGNFFMLGLTVQQVAADEDRDRAKKTMQVSYGRRLLLQAGWLAVALVAPCFYWIAAALPLLFPRATIFLMQITGRYRPEQKDGENQ